MVTYSQNIKNEQVTNNIKIISKNDTLGENYLKRNKSIDILRAGALLIVLTYHLWVLTGSVAIMLPIVDTIVPLGGELGVTLFFLLSGYGIYYSLKITEKKNGKIKYLVFLKKRLKRILPQYYFNLIFLLLFTGAAVYLSVEHILDILTHFLLIHNLFPDYHGAINGVLWTMGVIFQFYLVAIPIYSFIKKSKGIGVIVSIVVTILIKTLVFQKILVRFGDVSGVGFFAGRQLITSLDNFVIGMGVAYINCNYKVKIKNVWLYIGTIISLGYIYFICKLGFRYGIHTNNLSGYTWHSLIAIGLGAVMFFLSYIHTNENNLFAKLFLWISKYEYGIYIWHLVLWKNLLDNSTLIQSINVKLVWIILLVIAIIVGFIISEFVDGFEKDKIFIRKYQKTDKK